jgi:hypothetical protein
MTDWKAFWYFFDTYFNNIETKMNGGLGSTIGWEIQKHIIEFLIKFLHPHLIINMNNVWDTVYEIDSPEWGMQKKDIENAVEKELAQSKTNTSRIKSKAPFLRNKYE